MSDKQIKIVQQIYKDIETGNIPGILEQLTDDIEWREPIGGPEPWGGIHHGKGAVARFFQTLADAFNVEAFEPKEYVRNGDKVIALGYYRFSVKPYGPPFEMDWVMTWEFKGDKVKRFQAFCDTAIEIEALRIGQEAAAAPA